MYFIITASIKITKDPYHRGVEVLIVRLAKIRSDSQLLNLP